MASPSVAIAYGSLTVAAVLWGGSIVGQKYALASFSAVEVSVLRGIGALAILIPLWWLQEGRTIRLAGRDRWLLVLLGFAVLGNHLLTLFGLRYIGAAAAGVIIGASPAITALLSSLLVKDVPLRKVAAGSALSFAGVALVSGGGGENATGDNPWLGGTLVLLGLVSWALYTIGSGAVMNRLSPLTINWTTVLISIVLQIPVFLCAYQQMLEEGWTAVSSGGWIALGYLIVFATALGQQAWLYGVQGVGPSRAGSFVNLIPVSALLLSAMILGESVGPKETLGIVLILAGVWLVGYQTKDTSN